MKRTGWVGLLLLAGCRLAEVSTPGGEDLLVVEAVLRPDQAEQKLLLHHSVHDQQARGEPNALVRLRRDDGAEIAYRIAPEPSPGASPSPGQTDRCVDRTSAVFPPAATCYITQAGSAGFVMAGRSYDLDIQTPDGRHIRGRTQIPGAFGFHGSSALRAGSCVLPPNTPLEVAWSRSPGTWSYVANLEVRGLAGALAPLGIRNVPDPLNLFGLAISDADTTLLVPGDFGVFQRVELGNDLLVALQRGLPGGVEATLTLAAADRNYVNAIRGGRFNPSGNVRISTVVGDGVGVFGSIVPRILRIQVRNGTTRFPCVVPG
ncbi:MAG: DUF4249 family protein [Gemmatimonadota bacterium]|nr:DUF4249 family protein [Gemmatimonadota bacterium]